MDGILKALQSINDRWYYIQQFIINVLFNSRQLRENNRYLEITNNQLYNEMRKFQDEISSDEDEEEESKSSSKRLGLIEKLRIKREKEKIKRTEKLRLHLEEVEKYKSKIDELIESNRVSETNLKEKENKYDLLAEEFKSVQKNFSAYKTSREEVDI